MIRIFRYFRSLIVFLALGACATPEPVLDLAEKTAANTAFVSVTLQGIAKQSRRIAELRAANIARLHAVNADLRSRHNLDVALTEKSGDSAASSLVSEIEAWSKKVAEIQAAAVVDESKFVQEVLASRAELEARSKELAAVGKLLADLAKKESFKDRVKFLKGFVRDVAKEVEPRTKDGEKAAKSAASKVSDSKKKDATK